MNFFSFKVVSVAEMNYSGSFIYSRIQKVPDLFGSASITKAGSGPCRTASGFNQKARTVQIILYKDIEVTKIVGCGGAGANIMLFKRHWCFFYIQYFVVPLNLCNSTCICRYGTMLHL